jgi:class 3 adenylate cyclase/tetratricopeptide (TPR) repeat protein
LSFEDIKPYKISGVFMREPLIPVYLSQKLATEPKELSKLCLPCSFSERAGILNTDVCSFTSITQKLSAQGHYGVEGIITILNSYFTVMFECISSNGGSLIKYGGDAMFAVFPGQPELVVPRMLRCKSEMYRALQELNRSFLSKYGFEINFDGAIKYGEINLRVVGDPAYHVDYYIDGLAVGELFELGGEAPDGDMLIGSEMTQYLQAEYHPLQKTAVESSLEGQNFVSTAVSRKLQEKGFKAELRNSAVIFIHLSAKDGSALIRVEDYHEFYLKIQHHVYNLDGTINKIDFTDKGYLILVTFGTPYNHTDDVERAFTCAYRIRNIPSDTVSVKLGVTYSNIFAGILGAAQRHEYGIIGNAVNIAARLMANSQPGEISFSEEILPNVSSRFESEYVEETMVKGISSPLRIYKILSELPDSWFAMHSKYKDKELVSYQKELQEIREHLVAGQSCYIELVGEAGCGKTFLAYKILKSIKEQQPISVFVMEEFNSRNQCVWLLRVFAQKLMIFDLQQDFGLLEDFCAKAKISIEPDLLQRYFQSIGNTRVDLSKEEVDLACAKLAEIFAALFVDCRMIYIDDVQWMDDSSHQVFELMLPRLLESGSSVMLSRRGQPEQQELSLPADYSHLLELKNLEPEAANELIQREIPIIAADAVNSIYLLTKGNPLFMVEMAKVIRDNVDVQSAVLANADLKRLEKEGIISDTIENLLLHEYENLEPESQRTLKIASIIGKAFALEDLSLVTDADLRAEVELIIKGLSETKIIGKKSFDPGIEYIFNNQLMRDAIYRTILLGEKCRLHEKIGNFYETKYAEDVSRHLELIANHYIYAKNPAKALQYCMAAGEKTARLAAYPVSNYYYEKALSFCNDPATCYQIRLAMIKNCVSQGDASRGFDLLEEVATLHPQMLDDDYHLQKVRLFTLQGQNRKVVDYVSQIFDSIQSEFFQASIRLRYMDALQFLNRLDEFEAEAQKMQELLAQHQDLKLKGDYFTTMALMYMSRSDYPKAAQYYQQLLQHSGESKDLIHRRIALNGLGIVASRTAKKQEAREYFEQALSICEKLGDRNGYSKLITELGTLYRNEGEIDKAIQMYQISLQTARLVGNKNLEATVLYNIGEAHYYLQQDDIALEHFEQALEIYELSGDLVGRSYCYDAIGDLNFSRDNLDAAQELYEKNLVLQKELQDREGLAHTLGNLGNVAKGRGDFAKAIDYYQQQMPILTEVGDKDGLGRCYFNFAMTEKDQEHYDSAHEKLTQALALFRECQAQIFIDIAEEQLRDVEDIRKQV